MTITVALVSLAGVLLIIGALFWSRYNSRKSWAKHYDFWIASWNHHYDFWIESWDRQAKNGAVSNESATQAIEELFLDKAKMLDKLHADKDACLRRFLP
jgi:hypothetical protein